MSNRIAFTAASNGPAGPGQLKYAVADQARLSATLASRFCDFEVTGTQPTSSVTELRDGIFAAAERCRPGDTLVISFAGHAILDGGELFLLWNDSHPDRLLQTALPAHDVFTALNRSRASSKLLILDCCHAGAIASAGFRSKPETSLKAITSQADSFMMLLASDRLEKAREVEYFRGGFLTVTLCQSLSEIADADRDGQTSLADAVTYIRARAEEHNRWRPNEAVPVPLLIGKERGPIILTRVPEWEPWSFNIGSIEMVLLPLYWTRNVVAISKYPITNGQYREFVTDTKGEATLEPVGYMYDQGTGTWDEPFKPWDDPQYNEDDLPVVCVDYTKAREYCLWLSHKFGGWNPSHQPSDGVELGQFADWTQAISLPTAIVWDFAASGSFGPRPPRETPSRAMRTTVKAQPEIHQNSDTPAPVDRSGSRANSFGVSDMFGNVWEWCRGAPERWDTLHDHTAPIYSDEDLRAAESPRAVELRGGSFLDDASAVVPRMYASELRNGLNTSHTDLGFRICTLAYASSLPHSVDKLLKIHGVQQPMKGFQALPRLQ